MFPFWAKADEADQTLTHIRVSFSFLSSLCPFRYKRKKALRSRSPSRFLYFPSICSARENAVIMVIKEINLLQSAFVRQLKASAKTVILKPRPQFDAPTSNKIVEGNLAFISTM